jgi:hypothetical protein
MSVKQKIEILQKIKNDSLYGTKEMSNITFTVTTCKRYALFKKTMDFLILNCEDFDMLDEWLCVDDNSSMEDRDMMIREYPFMTFIMKKPEEKGHARSMNMILNLVKTKYIMHFEDDWICGEKFKIMDYLNYIKNNNVDHLVLKKIAYGNNLVVNDKMKIHKYIYDPCNQYKPELNKLYDYSVGHNRIHINDGWWWPGFTLNPSIIDFDKLKKTVGIFNEWIPHELFEYDYAIRCFENVIIVQFACLNIHHTGYHSSYALNNTKRYYD